MTSRERKLYWNKERNKTNRYVEIYKAKFYNALMSDVKKFENALLTHGFQGGRSFSHSLILNEQLTRTMYELIATVGVRYARDNYQTLRKEKGMGKSIDWVKRILEYLGRHFYDQSLYKIIGTTRKLFIDILNNSINNGWGINETVKNIRETIPEINKVRAEVIARTELNRAIHSGTFVGADASPYEKEKIWISAKDNRTRRNPDNKPKLADHIQLDGQTVDFNQDFIDHTNNHKLAHPGDPKGAAVDVINCRCTFAVKNKRGSDGRLVRKPNFYEIINDPNYVI